MKVSKSRSKRTGKVTLKTVAQQLGLTATTVSVVLNGSTAASSIPEKTRKRIIAAARELNYQPNFLARSLRAQRTSIVGVRMGRIAAETLLDRIEDRAPFVPEISVEPELVSRTSTGPPRGL
jgi:DNA-binding LacI/PurR family transcriptional regulator